MPFLMCIIDHFDDLVSKGLQIIPVRPNSKQPMQKGWTKWDKSSCRNLLRCCPDANLGLLLGDVIDVEGDTESANNILMDIIGDYPHPCYTSSRSVHHLFRTPDSTLRIIKHEGIEFRGRNHQSVLPPSHHQGIAYNWINPEFPVPEMPKSLLKFYSNIRNKSKGNGKSYQKGYVGVWCSKCKKRQVLHRKRFNVELEVFKRLNSVWECRKCRVVDLRPLCRQISGYKGVTW